MEPFIVKNQRKSPRVSAYLPALATYAGRRIEVRIENISRDGLYLFAPVPMKVRALFELLVYLPDSEEPIGMFVAACYAEQTPAGFGVGAYISGISTGARQRWEAHYERRLNMERGRSSERSALRLQRPRVLVLDHTLPAPSIKALAEQGLELVSPPEETPVLDRSVSAHVDLVIAELNDYRIASLAPLRHQRGQRPPVVLMTSCGSPQAFALGIEAGAARVIVKPCSRELLIDHVMQTLSSHLWNGGLAGGIEPSSAYRTEDSLSQGSLLRERRRKERSGIGSALRAAFRWVLGEEAAPKQAIQGTP
jgi:CheY-like chemotaxis protein